MKKSSIVFLVIAAIVLIGAILFYYYVSNLMATENGEGQEDEVVGTITQEQAEEISSAVDIEDITFKSSKLYKKDQSEAEVSIEGEKSAMILFFSPKNEDSVKMVNSLNDLYDTYKDSINIYVVSTIPSDEVSEEFTNNLKFELYYDSYKEASRDYKVDEIPTMICVKGNGEILTAKAGFVSTDALEANLEILADSAMWNLGE